MKQSRIISIAFSAAAIMAGGIISTNAQEYDKSGFSPITVGMTLEYLNHDADGSKADTYVLHVKEAEGNLQSGTVTFDQHFYDKDGQPLFDDNNLPMVVTVGGPEGTVSKMSDVGKVMKVQDIMSKGDASNVPSELKVGATIPDGKIKVQIGKISATITTVNRQVVDHKEITVPAGTFDCWLIREEQQTKTLGTKVEKVETWYARGIGCVKQSVYDKKGRLQHTQELVSFKLD